LRFLAKNFQILFQKYHENTRIGDFGKKFSQKTQKYGFLAHPPILKNGILEKIHKNFVK
jgi:hypothetical protein